MRFSVFLAAIISAAAVSASEDIADQYPQSELYSKPVEVIPYVFSVPPRPRPMKTLATTTTFRLL